MGSGVSGKMLENVDSEFGDINKDDIDNNDDFGIDAENLELKGKEVAWKLNVPSNKQMFEYIILITAMALIPLMESPRQTTTILLKLLL